MIPSASFRSAFARTGLVLLVLLCLGGPIAFGTPAGAQDITYTVMPTYNRIFWDDSAGVDDTDQLGANLAVGFGRFISLQGYYLTAETDRFLDPLGLDDDLEDFATQPIDLRSYGAEVMVNLSDGGWVPFLVGGGGLLDFQPDSGSSARRVNLRYGGGLRGTLSDLVTAEVSVQRSRYVSELPLLGTDGVSNPASEERTFHNTELRAGLGIKLGGGYGPRSAAVDRDVSRFWDDPLGGLAFPIEPIAGLQTFDNATPLEDQELIGVRSGLDFGRFIGLRGFYWKGVHNGFDAFSDVQSYGGEAQFSLGAGAGLSPHLLLGVGQLDFESSYGQEDYDEPLGFEAQDRTALIVGGGANLGLGENLNLSVQARDYVVAASGFEGSSDPVDEVSSEDDLLHNWQFVAGLNLRIGGGGGLRVDRIEGALDEREARIAELERELQEAREERELERRTADRTADRTSDRDEQDMERNRDRMDPETMRRMTFDSVAFRPENEGTITLPAPTVGELYVRFGPGTSPLASADGDGNGSDQSGAAPAGARTVTPQDLETLRAEILEETATKDDIDALRDLLLAQGDRAPVRVEVEPGQRRVGDTTEVDATERRIDVDVMTPVERVRSRPARVYASYAADPDQLVLGATSDYRTLDGAPNLHLMPEFAVGFGEADPSFLFAGNLEYRPVVLQQDTWALEPFAGGGAGLLLGNDTQAVVNLMYGTELDLEDALSGSRFFVAHQGIDFFNQNRLLLGLVIQR